MRRSRCDAGTFVSRSPATIARTIFCPVTPATSLIARMRPANPS
jgi:hypothetical protein